MREWPVLAPLPDPVEAYIRPIAGRTTFTIFPWSGFLFAGVIAGELITAARTQAAESRLHAGLLAAGIAGIAVGYWMSFQPSIYPVANSGPLADLLLSSSWEATGAAPIARWPSTFPSACQSVLGSGDGTTTLGRARVRLFYSRRDGLRLDRRPCAACSPLSVATATACCV